MGDTYTTEHKKVNIYGSHRPAMERCLADLLLKLQEFRAEIRREQGVDPVEHMPARIKSEESMIEKCGRKGLPVTEESALTKIHDGIGVRLVCGFLNDVYAMRDKICADPELEVVGEKDYIRDVKPNGYRSLHLIVRFSGYFAEIQIRTISMDTWASLEHHMKYKKTLDANTQLIVRELKRCADELASTDVTMQTIRDMIAGIQE